MIRMAHRIEPEPPLDLVYLVKCLVTLGVIGMALYLAILVGWASLG